MGIEVKDLDKCDIANSDIKNNTNHTDVPGYLAVQVDNCKLEPEEYIFYGVNNKNGMISGQGVTADKTIIDQNDNFFLLFDIKKLRANNQLDDTTKEIAIKIHGHELGRDKINHISGIYLG